MVGEHDNAAAAKPRILVADDVMANRFALRQLLGRMQAEVVEAADGLEAMARLEEGGCDLVLLDIEMPGMNGREVLARMKSSEGLRDIPVLIISSIDDVESVAGSIVAGADDYLTKPFNPTILSARVNASLERKRLRDRELQIMADLARERERSEQLLNAILPPSIAARLKNGETTIADSYAEATVLYAQITDVAMLSEQMSASAAVSLLNDLFTLFDTLSEQHGVEKINTVGDVYLGVAGIPESHPEHARSAAAMALAMQRESARLVARARAPVGLRIGISTGPVVAGVIGKTKFSYDVWGEPVNVANFLALYGVPGGIQIAEETNRSLAGRYMVESRGSFYVEGRGEIDTYLLVGEL